MIHALYFPISKALKLAAVASRQPLSLKSSFKCGSRQITMENGHKSDSRGALIVLEGLDRSGKTSQSSRLISYLEGLGHSVESWRFPDRNTGVGQMISSYLTNKSQLDDHAIHLLFSANRWEKRCRRKGLQLSVLHMPSKTFLSFLIYFKFERVTLIWLPVALICRCNRSLMGAKLRSGTTLIVDRYSFSGVAFSSAKGLDIEWCKAPEMGLLAPDMVLYLDIPPEKAAERGGYGGERYEQLEFQRKVAHSYQLLHDASWKSIDASLPMENVEKQLKEMVLDCVTACQKGKALSNLWSS